MKYPKMSKKEKKELAEEVAKLPGPFVTHVIEKDGREWSYSRNIKDPDVQAYLLGIDNRLPGKKPRKVKP